MKKCFFAVEQRVIFTSRALFSAIEKDVLLASFLSNLVYNFLCHSSSRYVGRTSQRLQERIRQHVPKFIRTSQISNFRNISTDSGKYSTPVSFRESAIGQHLLVNLCAPKTTVIKNFFFFYLSFRFFIYLLWKRFTSNHASQFLTAKKSLYTT